MPINLDRHQRASATLLREVATRAGGFEFYSFSSPVTDEDRRRGPGLWGRENVTRVAAPSLLLRRFDIAHTATATRRNETAVRLARLRGGARHVFTANTQINRDDPLLPYFERAARSADTVVSVSEAVASDLRSAYGVESDAIIPNGVDLDLFDGRRDRPPPPDLAGLPGRYFAFIGSVEPRKRPDLLVEIARRAPAHTFVVAGGQNDPRLVAAVDAEPNIINTGARTREEVRDLLSRALALVFPSDLEGLPLSVIEAMAMGVPVLARPVSSLPELVREGDNGFLVGADDLDAWARRLDEVAGWDEAGWRERAAAVRAGVVGRYSYDAIAASYAEVYRRALAPQRC